MFVVVFSCTGFVELRNWKSLPLSVITDNQNLTVEQIFSDICAAVTFRIHLSK
jgi:Ubiquitin-like oligomerisation domain of SATB